MYIRGETVDRADAMCRSIATELQIDEILKSPREDGKDDFQAQEDEDRGTEDSFSPDEPQEAGLYPYNDSMLFLELRKATGIEEGPEPPNQENVDIKKAFTLEEETRKIDIRA